MKTCPDCNRPYAENYEAWKASGEINERPNWHEALGEYKLCGNSAEWDDDFWGDETIPDCNLATIAFLKARLTWQSQDPLYVLTRRTEIVILRRIEGGWMPERAVADPEHGTIRCLSPLASQSIALDWNPDWRWLATPT